MPKIAFQSSTHALPPIKLDGNIYVVLAGSYQRLVNERVVTERYTSNGNLDIQIQNTRKCRWNVTLMVPLTSSNVTVSDADFTSSDMGILQDLQDSIDKVGSSSRLNFYDIDSNWDFSGSVPYMVYINKADNQAPNQHDIGVWQVPISLWGYVSVWDVSENETVTVSDTPTVSIP